VGDVIAEVDVEAVIARLKAEGTAIEFPGGRLKAITEATPELAAMMAKWRRNNPQGFATRFRVTDEGTLTYLQEQVIDNPQRVLFLIMDEDDRPVGNLGFVRSKVLGLPTELDNGVRGEPAPRGLMRSAFIALLGWMADNISMDPVVFRVMGSNHRALRIYESFGVREINRINLIEQRDGDRVALVPGETNVVDQYVTMLYDPKTQRSHDVEPPVTSSDEPISPVDLKALEEASQAWLLASARTRYSYNFTWMGRPIIQYPQDIVALQQLIWQVQPDLIVETGIAHGGSLILSSSLLELNALSGGPSDARVLGIDIDIRDHNRAAIENHPMHKRIDMIQGSSIDPAIVDQVRAAAEGKQRVLVILDSNHTHAHVLAELDAYAPLTTVGSYCIVFDTLVERLPKSLYPDRPWGPGDNPETAVHEYLATHPEFVIDTDIDRQLAVSVAPNGYLRRVR